MSVEKFSVDQKIAWELLQGDENVFLTGEAGSGKSYVVREFTSGLDAKEFPILASTGAAAVLVGGRTFHSFMGLGIMDGGVSATVERALGDRRVVRRIKKAKGVVIDEVSMLSGDTLRAAEQICRKAREELELPWGGLRIVAVGDFAQLPPVVRGRQKREWAFLDPVWKISQFQSVLLKQNMRSQDKDFLKVLNDVRDGRVNEEVFQYLNQKLISDDAENFVGTRLFPLRRETDKYNLQQLEKISEKEFCFKTEYVGNERSVEALKKSVPLPEELKLKEGALVMLRQNDPRMRWVNGSTGYVRGIKDDEILVELLSGRMANVERACFSLLNAEGKLMAAATNFPLSLAYAATIHKAQGMTLDRLLVDLNALWEPGQAYVALSRIKDPEHLKISRWSPNSIRADQSVKKFYQDLDENMGGSIDSFLE